MLLNARDRARQLIPVDVQLQSAVLEAFWPRILVTTRRALALRVHQPRLCLLLAGDFAHLHFLMV